MVDVHGAAVSGPTLPATAWRLFMERSVEGSADAGFPAPLTPAEFGPWIGQYSYRVTTSPSG
jgi:hypothetical protein